MFKKYFWNHHAKFAFAIIVYIIRFEQYPVWTVAEAPRNPSNFRYKTGVRPRITNESRDRRRFQKVRGI